MRRTLTLATLMLITVGGTVTALAQEGQMDPQAMEQLMVKLMTPGKQHQFLSRMEGDWTAHMVSYMESPEPIESQGTYTAEPVLGGRYMLGRYHGMAMGQPFEGLSIDGYDNGKQEYFSIWLDNFGTGYYIAHGGASEDGKTMRHSGTMNFGPMEIPSRSETVVVSDDEVKFTMWHTMGGQEMKAMDITYKRVE